LTTLLNRAEKSGVPCAGSWDLFWAAAIIAAASAAADDDEIEDGDAGAIELDGDGDCCC
jgi:hypothetical protein